MVKYINDYDYLTNTTMQQILDAISEFYLLTNSEHIYYASMSGFSIIASKFNNIQINIRISFIFK